MKTNPSPPLSPQTYGKKARNLECLLGPSHWLHEISLPKRVGHHFWPGLTPLANNTLPINVVVVMKGPGWKGGQWEQHNLKGKSLKCGNWVVVLQAKRWWVVVRFQCQAHTHTHTHFAFHEKYVMDDGRWWFALLPWPPSCNSTKLIWLYTNPDRTASEMGLFGRWDEG
jgi:hypothetical protein